MNDTIPHNGQRILLAHGAGGRLTHELIRTLFKPAFSNAALNSLDDAACVRLTDDNIAFTIDSFVVDPLSFPGGDIGRLAVCGTVNDLAMKGARPRAIAIAAIIEEGLDRSILKHMTASAARAAREAGVIVVTGDTKVVGRGTADKLFLTTAGIGGIPAGRRISGSGARPGDAVLINGPLGDHGVAVLAARQDFKLTVNVRSDCAPLNHLVDTMFRTRAPIHVLRDPTRGGLATTLNEIAAASRVGIIINESDIPVRSSVRNACALLGLDPLYVANEGKLVACVPENVAGTLRAAMRRVTHGKGTTVIGRVVAAPTGVWLQTAAGGIRPIGMLEGDQLPRIC